MEENQRHRDQKDPTFTYTSIPVGWEKGENYWQISLSSASSPHLAMSNVYSSKNIYAGYLIS